MTEMHHAAKSLQNVFRDKGWKFQQIPHADGCSSISRHVLKKWSATSRAGVKIERWSRHALLIEIALIELTITSEAVAEPERLDA